MYSFDQNARTPPHIFRIYQLDTCSIWFADKTCETPINIGSMTVFRLFVLLMARWYRFYRENIHEFYNSILHFCKMYCSCSECSIKFNITVLGTGSESGGLPLLYSNFNIIFRGSMTYLIDNMYFQSEPHLNCDP